MPYGKCIFLNICFELNKTEECVAIFGHLKISISISLE